MEYPKGGDLKLTTRTNSYEDEDYEYNCSNDKIPYSSTILKEKIIFSIFAKKKQITNIVPLMPFFLDYYYIFILIVIITPL